jgi:hypothetical protein
MIELPGKVGSDSKEIEQKIVSTFEGNPVNEILELQVVQSNHIQFNTLQINQ